jgi:hypothetical protein
MSVLRLCAPQHCPRSLGKGPSPSDRPNPQSRYAVRNLRRSAVPDRGPRATLLGRFDVGAPLSHGRCEDLHSTQPQATLS